MVPLRCRAVWAARSPRRRWDGPRATAGTIAGGGEGAKVGPRPPGWICRLPPVSSRDAQLIEPRDQTDVRCAARPPVHQPQEPVLRRRPAGTRDRYPVQGGGEDQRGGILRQRGLGPCGRRQDGRSVWPAADDEAERGGGAVSEGGGG